MSELIDIAPELTPNGMLAAKVGKVLTFVKDGVPTHLKVVRKDKKAGKIWVKKIELHDPENVDVVDK